jgi:hypothetical protein
MMPGRISADNPKRCAKTRGFPGQMDASLVRDLLTDRETLNRVMPNFLESGKLQLTPDEADAYRLAASRLQESCEVALDLTRPISVQDWTLLHVAQEALAGDLDPLDQLIGTIETAIRSRASRN